MKKDYKKVKSNVLRLCSIIALLFSCNKQEVAPSITLTENQPKVEDGRLQFGSINSFGTYLENFEGIAI